MIYSTLALAVLCVCVCVPYIQVLLTSPLAVQLEVQLQVASEVQVQSCQCLILLLCVYYPASDRRLGVRLKFASTVTLAVCQWHRDVLTQPESCLAIRSRPAGGPQAVDGNMPVAHSLKQGQNYCHRIWQLEQPACLHLLQASSSHCWLPHNLPRDNDDHAAKVF